MKCKFVTAIFILMALIFNSASYAQTPQLINYQAVAKGSDGSVIANQSISGKFIIRNANPTGSLVYEEAFVTTTNDYGVFVTKIGGNDATTGNFAGIDWTSDSKYLEVLLDLTGGTNYQSISTSQFVSVPYALSAETISNPGSITLSQLGDVNGTPGQGQILQWDGSSWVPTTVNAGTNGVDGKTILSGPSNPSNGLGNIGDFYLNTATNDFFGPKTASSWGTGVSLVGPAGAQGQTGAAGATGPQGPTGPAGSYTAGTGISLAGNVITNTGDTDASNDVTTASTAGGDVTGVFSNLQIASGAIGSNEIANGSIGAADLAAGVIPSSLPPSGTAGGDLAGTYPNPTVDGLQSVPVSSTAPSSGQVLKYNGTSWAPAADNSGLTLPYNNTVNSASTLIAVINSGTGGGITGITSGNATVAGVFGESTNPSGGNGVWGRSNVGQGYGVWGTSTSGIGVVGETNNTTNAAGQFSNSAAGGDALNIQGGLKVSGTVANRAAFQITAALSNLVLNGTDELSNALVIDNANANNNPTCMLFVTRVDNNSIPENAAVSVNYNSATGRWRIRNFVTGAIQVGEVYNVLVIDF